MKFVFSVVVVLLSVFYVNEEIHKKIISDDQYQYEFYVTSKEILKYKTDKIYFSFKSGKIHKHQGGSVGEVLHGKYNKNYVTNILAEQGVFNYGLKDNVWRSWHPNGNLRNITHWKQGVRSGDFTTFNTNGEIIITGKYLAGLKHGKWITHSTKDTLYFKKGNQVIKEEKVLEEKKETTKKSLYTKIKGAIKDVFQKKTPEEKQQKALEKQKREQQKALELRRKELAKKKKNKGNTKK